MDGMKLFSEYIKAIQSLFVVIKQFKRFLLKK